MSYQLLKNLIIYGEQQEAKNLKLDIRPLQAKLSFKILEDEFENLSLSHDSAWNLYKQIQDYFNLDPRKNQSVYKKFPYKHQEIGLKIDVVHKSQEIYLEINYKPKTKQTYKLSRLGIPTAQLKYLTNYLQQGKGGVILVTGQENSGISTTLKAMFKRANQEHYISFVLEKNSTENLNNSIQINLNQEIRQAHPILQDLKKHHPNIIVIDEIENTHMLNTALEYGQQGILVLAGYRANSALEALEKVRQETNKKHSLGQALTLITHQKLVPRLCPGCLERVETGDKTIRNLKEIGQDQNINPELKLDHLNFYISAGCIQCNQSGFVGNIGIFEFLRINAKVKQQLSKSQKISPDKSFKPIFQDALKKIHYGISSYEEVVNLFV